MSRRWVLAGAIALLPFTAHAQAQAQSQAACDYARCALRIVPRLSGLDVVRGDADERAGSLNFLWPSAAITRVFRHDARAALFAQSSVRKRRTAALLTDAGGVLIVAALVRGVAARHDPTPSAVLGGIGVAALAVSVPMQFAADEELSKAVHGFNRRFAR